MVSDLVFGRIALVTAAPAALPPIADIIDIIAGMRNGINLRASVVFAAVVPVRTSKCTQ